MKIPSIDSFIPSMKSVRKAACAGVIAAQTMFGSACTMVFKTNPYDMYVGVSAPAVTSVVVNQPGYNALQYCLYCASGVVHNVHRMSTRYYQQPVCPPPMLMMSPPPVFYPPPYSGNIILAPNIFIRR